MVLKEADSKKASSGPGYVPPRLDIIPAFPDGTVFAQPGTLGPPNKQRGDGLVVLFWERCSLAGGSTSLRWGFWDFINSPLLLVYSVL